MRSRPLLRAFSNEDMRIAQSMKPCKMDISNQFAIKINGDPSLSLIINQFQEGGISSILSQVMESSGETLRIDSNLSSSAGNFLEI